MLSFKNNYFKLGLKYRFSNHLSSIKMPLMALTLNKQVVVKGKRDLELLFNTISFLALIGIFTWVIINEGQYLSIETDDGYVK